MPNKLEKQANNLRNEILTLVPTRANIVNLKNITQKLVETLTEIGSENSEIAKDGLLHTLEQEIHLAEVSKKELDLVANFEKAQGMISIDFLGFEE